VMESVNKRNESGSVVNNAINKNTSLLLRITLTASITVQKPFFPLLIFFSFLLLTIAYNQL